jgi:hypothetical protein
MDLDAVLPLQSREVGLAIKTGKFFGQLRMISGQVDSVEAVDSEMRQCHPRRREVCLRFA